ncbi:MAG: ferritin family protein [Candidatus Cloacimonas sp.]|jgi:rubrerythrin|nr:hypothetical protein [Candidatus Cloacimonadota bacterium]
MKKEQLLEAIKKAMRAELDSVNLYQSALNASDDQEVKDFFQERVDEEKRHYNYLLNYYKEIESDKKLTDLGDIFSEPEAETIFSEGFLRRIGEKQVLFSAISTAVLLEKEALQHYKNLAQDTDEQELKDFFSHMGSWETQHYMDVLKIQQEAEKFYWEINDFEPF